jgi:hypothetical protein
MERKKSESRVTRQQGSCPASALRNVRQLVAETLSDPGRYPDRPYSLSLDLVFLWVTVSYDNSKTRMHLYGQSARLALSSQKFAVTYGTYRKAQATHVQSMNRIISSLHKL